MQRIHKYTYVISSTLVSKSALFNFKPAILKLKLVAGLYKPASVRLEYGLILSSICGLLTVPQIQLHGKRKKKTVSFNASLYNKNVWAPVDKIINELLPRVGDFRTLKFKKPNNNNYTLRLKEKFAPLKDFEELVSSEMLDKYRGIFLPLSIHFSIGENLSRQASEIYIRALRAPFNFYVRYRPPAFDDLTTF